MQDRVLEPIPFQPGEDRVLVRRIAEQIDAKSILCIREHPECVDVVSNQVDGNHGDYRRTGLLGVIVAVGPGKMSPRFKFRPTTVKPGEVIVFSNWNDWEDAPEGLYLIREADIWGYASA
jgi:co-chaperonin GroES (HSP10)